MKAALDAVARGVHAVHGTRGLTAAVLAMLALTLIEPAVPAGFARAILAAPVFLLGVVALATLPREGVAVQLRLRRLVEDKGAGRQLGRDLAWPAILVVLLLPQAFLAAYGIPHMSPLSGLVLPSMVRRMAAFFLFGLLLLPVLHMRRTRRYAPEVVSMRPVELRDRDGMHVRRDVLLGLMGVVAFVWLSVLEAFWAPFSLLAWPPTFASFGQGIRAVAAVAYTLFLPVVLFVHLSAHAQGLRYLIQHGKWRTHRWRFTALWLHVALGIAATALHIYNLLWIVRYQNAVGF